MEYCAGCHGVDARGGAKAPSLLSGDYLKSVSESDIYATIHDGTKSGMPPFAQIGNDNIVALVRYLRLLQGGGTKTSVALADAPLPGDAVAGRSLFFGKALCSRCHMVNGEGGFIARSLTTFGRGHSAEAMVFAITHPEEGSGLSSRVVSVITNSGQKLSGVLRNEDNFTLALQTEDGRYHLFARDELKSVQYSNHSLMPRDYAARLTTPELNNLVSYLMLVSRPLDKCQERVR